MILYRYAVVLIILIIQVSVMSLAWCNPIYSSNGIGMIIPDDAGRSTGMGGAGIASGDEMNMMRDNPALLASFNNHLYSIGANYNRNTAFTGGKESPTNAKTSLDMFKIIVPIYQGIVIGWGLSPFSQAESVIEYHNEQYTDKMTSTGGLNVSTFGLAGSIKEFVRLGISLNYNFGMIQNEWSRKFSNVDEFDESTTYIKRKYKGYNATAGIIVNVLKNTSVGVGYTGETDMDMSVMIRPGNFSNPEQRYDSRMILLPELWRLGIASTFKKRFAVSMDYSLGKWKEAAITAKEEKMYQDTYSFGAGVRFAPREGYETSYYRNIPISAGFKIRNLYYKSYPKIETIFEKAITLGAEFPFKENMASLIISFELGMRGEKSKNGWDETYMGLDFLLIGSIK
ncbi:MAG: hypothetical protein HOC71_04855 [Candidatus Latescibacteria bacterium]|jgi:hypothetical protein|nr:hypothetical protein [Candidatus Latescibacterota bacterium]